MREKSAKSHEEYERYFYDEEYSKVKSYKLANWHQAYLDKIFKNLKFENGDIFLDVGAGGLAYTVIEFARKNITSIGIDISRTAMATAYRLARENLTNPELCHFIVASATHVPLRTNSINKLVSIAVLEHVPNDDLAILEMARLSKRRAKLFITVPNKCDLMEKLPVFRSLYKKHDQKVGHLRHYNAEELIDKFSKAGFTVKRIMYHVHLPRLLSFIIEKIFGTKNILFKMVWWKLEYLDQRLSTLPSGMHISVIFKK
jgi:ubiquinone/menaquinone biosynthesis C-methylase UbiE